MVQLFDLPLLQTERLTLREWRESDAEDMFEYTSDQEVTRFAMWPRETSIEETRKGIRNAILRYESRSWVYWGIEHTSDRKLIGSIGFPQWNRHDARAELGYALNRHYWNQGLTSEACERVIAFGWEQMALHRIEANCLEMNYASSALLEKFGFELEGVKREAALIDSDYVDVGIYGLLRPSAMIDR